jgi:hypothetical protein
MKAVIPTSPDLIRRVAIRAMAAAGREIGLLVLKGGNALAVVYGIGGRTSLDLDYSLATDFADVRLAEAQISARLAESFRAAGFELFDVQFLLRPPEPTVEWWGGYEVRFKLVPLSEAGSDLDIRRRTATVVGLAQERIFKIQISRNEFVGDTLEEEVDGVPIAVYSPALIAAEKVRAICQQMPEYPHARYRHPRARDFFDIRSICLEASVDLTAPANAALVRKVFEAKRVPLELLGRVETTREFHRPDWPAVELSVRSLDGDFDLCFDFVADLCRRLEAAGHV